MFRGFLAFDGVEVLNVARTWAYVRNGRRPPEYKFAVDSGTADTAPGLPAALGHAPYRTPELDACPWFDVNDPTTGEFVGLLPVDVTGLEGSTFTADVTESLGDGGVVAAARRGSRTIAVTALLLGETAGGLRTGLEWLTGVLLRQCGDVTVPANLTALTQVPADVVDVEDVTKPLVTATVAPSAAGWATAGGTWDYNLGVFTVPPPVVTTPTGGTVDTIDGGNSSTVGTDFIDGGGLADVPDVIDGVPPGVPVVTGGVGRLIGPDRYACLSQVDVTWTFAAISGSVTVTTGIVSDGGDWLDTPDAPVTVGSTAVTVTRSYTNLAYDGWRPAIDASTPGLRVTLKVATRPLIDPTAALVPLRRTYPQVRCVAPPQVTAEYVTNDPDSDGGMWQVEWTWVAEDPYRYADQQALVLGYTTQAQAATYTAPGVSVQTTPLVTSAATDCPQPTTGPGSCATDPLLPGWVAPPKVPVIGDLPYTLPLYYRRHIISLDPSVTPVAGTDALTIRLGNNGYPKRGFRFRFWSAADPDFSLIAECDFENEVWVDYLDPNAELIIDTVTGTVTAICADGSFSDARAVVRGPYRGSLRFPTVACQRYYFIAFDNPVTADPGDFTLAVGSALREG